MYMQTPTQPRSTDTVFTNRSAANSWPSGGFGDPGSVTTVTNTRQSSRYALNVLAIEVVSLPPSTTVLASMAMPTVVARSMAGASTRCTAPVVLPDVTVHCPQSASTAGSKVTRPMTAACTMPPGPDA